MLISGAHTHASKETTRGYSVGGLTKIIEGKGWRYDTMPGEEHSIHQFSRAVNGKTESVQIPDRFTRIYLPDQNERWERRPNGRIDSRNLYHETPGTFRKISGN